MPSSRVRVVPVYQPRGLLPLAAAVGIAGGIYTVLVSHYGHILIFRTLNQWAWAPGWLRDTAVALLHVSPVVVPPVLLAAFLCRVNQRARRVALTVGMVMLALIVTAFPVSILLEHGGGAGTWRNTVGWPLLMVPPIAVGFGLLVGLAVFGFIRMAIFTTAEQTGTLCWRCGYDLGSAALNTCPECAEPAARGRFRGRRLVGLLAWMQGRGRALLAVALVAVLGWAVYRLAAVTVPSHRFLESLDPGGSRTPANDAASRRFLWVYVDAARPSGSGGGWTSWSWDGLGVFTPVAGDPARAIGCAYWPRGARGAAPWVRMRVFVTEPPVPVAMPGGMVLPSSAPSTYMPQPTEGTVRVFCDLNAAQARRVIEAGGVPDSLRDELLHRAAAAGWAKDPVYINGPNYTAKEEEVQADGHFPE